MGPSTCVNRFCVVAMNQIPGRTLEERKCLYCVTLSEGFSPCGKEGMAEIPTAGMHASEQRASGPGL